ncbi:MAG: hypothetical protein ABMA64_41085, partial [Myxococcota bacterium]
VEATRAAAGVAPDGSGARTERDLRSTLATLALACGDLEEFGRQLPLLEMLGADPGELLYHRVSLTLLEGQPERAAVQLALSEASTPRERRARGFLAAWAALLQGRIDRAAAQVEQLEPPIAGRDAAMAALLRGLCAAASGDAEGARAWVASVEPPRRAGARAWVDAALAVGTPGFDAALAEAERVSVDDLGFRLARQGVERARRAAR